MSRTKNNISDFSIIKNFWSLFLLAGFQMLIIGGIIILVVPLSYIFWPNDPYHELEMGIFISSMFWLSALGGVLFGFLIDKYSRKNIMFINSIFRGLSIVMLGFAHEGNGFETWLYFLVLVSIFSFFAGGSWPSIVSLSNDVTPKHYRSRFFGFFGITIGTFTIIGILLSTFLVEYGYWKEFFWGIGTLTIITSFAFFIHINEPQRGAQQKEVSEIIKKEYVNDNLEIKKSTSKRVILSKTNSVVLIQGILSNIFVGSMYMLILPYIQTPPHNISIFLTGVFIITFGFTGGLMGRLFFSRLCDKVSIKHPIIRIYFIILSLIISYLAFTLIFFIPLPKLTVAQGKNLLFLATIPIFMIIGILFFISSAIASLYPINQPPILQDINLPDTLGKISSWNQLLEYIGLGIGPLVVGIFLIVFDRNYQIVVLLLGIFQIPSILFWFLSLKWYSKDKNFINKILEKSTDLV